MRTAKFPLLAMHGVLQKSVKFINTWPLYMHKAVVIMHGRPDVTLVGSAAHYVSRSVLSFPMINVCGSQISATIQVVLIIQVACESS